MVASCGRGGRSPLSGGWVEACGWRGNRRGYDARDHHDGSGSPGDRGLKVTKIDYEWCYMPALCVSTYIGA